MACSHCDGAHPQPSPGGQAHPGIAICWPLFRVVRFYPEVISYTSVFKEKK